MSDSYQVTAALVLLAKNLVVTLTPICHHYSTNALAGPGFENT
jgi:hypothetical protein